MGVVFPVFANRRSLYVAIAIPEIPIFGISVFPQSRNSRISQEKIPEIRDFHFCITCL